MNTRSSSFTCISAASEAWLFGDSAAGSPPVSERMAISIQYPVVSPQPASLCSVCEEDASKQFQRPI